MNRRTKRRAALALSAAALAAATGVTAAGSASGADAQGADAQGKSARAEGTRGAGAQEASAQGAGAQGASARGANAQGAGAQDESAFAGSLDGADEVPVPGGPAVGDKDGKALAVMRVQGDRVSFRFTFRGIAAPTAGHVHEGAKGQNGPVRIAFFTKEQPGGGHSVSGTVRVTDGALLERLRTEPRNFYFNLHTAEFPGGAVRGQVQGLAAPHSAAGLDRSFQSSVVRGAQVYKCVNGAFVQDNVRAVLDRGIAHFFAKAGPQGPPAWLAADRSAVTGKAVARFPNGERNIPELDLLATRAGRDRGLLSRTNEILRLNTAGGVAPSGACEEGRRAAVPYRADYVFLGR
ncbi:CHRD domain-containing protein [Streptomyces sp. ODS28]|uniref:CHRD domain-containing protein n=1 Tax=Streptomyces sp. ODS28 TaxID=3136688 RepID=UPI0031EB018E